MNVGSNIPKPLESCLEGYSEAPSMARPALQRHAVQSACIDRAFKPSMPSKLHLLQTTVVHRVKEF